MRYNKIINMAVLCLSAITFNASATSPAYKFKQYVPGIKSATVQGMLVMSPGEFDFGSVAIGQTTDGNLKFTTTGNIPYPLELPTLPTGYSTVADTCQASVPVGSEGCDWTVRFSPTNGQSYNTGVLVDGQMVLLKGVGLGPGVLVTNPAGATLTYANTLVDSSSVAQEVTLTNTGGQAIPLSAISSVNGFTVNSTCGSSLIGNESCVVSVQFSPTARISYSETLNLGGQSKTLTGNGVITGVLTAAPTSINFGSVNIGQAPTQNITFTNTGDFPVSSIAIGTTGTGYNLVSTTCTGATLNSSQSCTATVSLSPTEVGAASGSAALTYQASSQGKSLSVPLTGAGTTVEAHYAIATSSGMYWSPDLITWTQDTGATAGLSMAGVAYGNGRFLATAGSSSGRGIYSSSDGKAWVQTSPAVASAYYSQVIWTGTTFVLNATDGTIYKSMDGTSWTSGGNITTALTVGPAGNLFGLKWKGACPCYYTLYRANAGTNYNLVTNINGVQNDYANPWQLATNDTTYASFNSAGQVISFTWGTGSAVQTAQGGGQKILYVHDKFIAVMGGDAVASATGTSGWTTIGTGLGAVYGGTWDGVQYVLVGTSVIKGTNSLTTVTTNLPGSVLTNGIGGIAYK